MVEIQALKDWFQCDDMTKSYVLASLDEAYTSDHSLLDDDTIMLLSPIRQIPEHSWQEVIASFISLRSKSTEFVNEYIGDAKFWLDNADIRLSKSWMYYKT